MRTDNSRSKKIILALINEVKLFSLIGTYRKTIPIKTDLRLKVTTYIDLHQQNLEMNKNNKLQYTTLWQYFIIENASHKLAGIVIGSVLRKSFGMFFTLSSDEDEGDLAHVSILRHLCVVVVDGVETGLVLQAEHEDDSVHPGRELKR